MKAYNCKHTILMQSHNLSLTFADYVQKGVNVSFIQVEIWELKYIELWYKINYQNC